MIELTKGKKHPLDKIVLRDGNARVFFDACYEIAQQAVNEQNIYPDARGGAELLAAVFWIYNQILLGKQPTEQSFNKLFNINKKGEIMEKCPKCGGKLFENKGVGKKGPYHNIKCANNRMTNGTCDYIEWKDMKAQPTQPIQPKPAQTLNIEAEFKKINEKLDKILTHYYEE